MKVRIYIKQSGWKAPAGIFTPLHFAIKTKHLFWWKFIRDSWGDIIIFCHMEEVVKYCVTEYGETVEIDTGWKRI
jgi:hypothetical protein